MYIIDSLLQNTNYNNNNNNKGVIVPEGELRMDM